MFIVYHNNTSLQSTPQNIYIRLQLRYIEIPEHTETPEHTGNYRNTLHFFFIIFLLYFLGLLNIFLGEILLLYGSLIR